LPSESLHKKPRRRGCSELAPVGPTEIEPGSTRRRPEKNNTNSDYFQKRENQRFSLFIEWYSNSTELFLLIQKLTLLIILSFGTIVHRGYVLKNPNKL
jgi:hypothetical protein